MLWPMEAGVQLVMEAHQGVASMSDLSAAGLTHGRVLSLLAAGALVRIRRDALVEGLRWRDAAPEQRHVLRGRAVMRSVDPTGALGHALSHHSSLAVQGVAVLGGDDRVHLVRTDARRGHHTPTTLFHPPVEPRWTQVVAGVRVVHPAMAALQVAGRSGVEAGLVGADSALHAGLCVAADLSSALEAGSYNHGTRAATIVVDLADARLESPGESRLRWALHLMGYVDLVPQALIADELGVVVARVDFLLAEHRVVIEFDGQLKYVAATDVWQEKKREDRIRELGYEVVRVTWGELGQPAVIRAKVQRAISRAALRPRRSS